MSCVGGALVYRRLRAPRRHGEALTDPPLADAGNLLERNAAALTSAQATTQLHGRSLTELAESGRRELLDAARTYTSSYRDVHIDEQSHVLLTGHQPELYHPGVWFKNIALDALARRVAATPINLIIDNDLPHGTSVLCPKMDLTAARAVSIPFDRPGHFVPYEERGILDRSQFDSFGSRLAEGVRAIVPDPIVSDFWPLAIEAAQRTSRLGLAVAQARHQWEAGWGLQTLEVPWSQVCDTPSFRWFAAHLLVELPRLHQHYNEALLEYRRLHGLRSRTHPVADLERTDEWYEAPLWIWASHDPHRRRLFVRRNSECIELSDRRRLRLCLPLRGDDLTTTLSAWQAAGGSGIKIRPRALITTMYARLVLGNLFLHGIGGAKYDQLTDEIVRRFFDREPPAFMTVTATVLLPTQHENVQADDVRRVDRLLRELRFHPEKHAPANEDVQRLAEEKSSWINTQVPVERLKERHQSIARVNELLQPWVQPLREKLLVERHELASRLRRAKITNSREYSFCLFPNETLHNILLDILNKHF